MHVRVVLVRPIYPGNVGAALRAAANFAVDELVVVAPRAVLDDPDFRRMAMGAREHVPIREVRTLGEATSDLDVVVGTTSLRSRDPRGVHTPVELVERLAGTGAGTVALVFGPEQSGLTHEELAACHLLVSVPTSPAFPVLNLSQAVGIVLATLSAAELQPPGPIDELDAPAGDADLSAALGHLEQSLTETGFLDVMNPARVMDQIRRLVGRAVPTRREVAILRGIASHLRYIWMRSSREG